MQIHDWRSMLEICCLLLCHRSSASSLGRTISCEMRRLHQIEICNCMVLSNNCYPLVKNMLSRQHLTGTSWQASWKLWWTDLTWQEEQAYYQTHDGIISTFILRNFSIRKSARLSSNDHHRGQYHVSLVQQNIYIFILVSPWLSTCSTLSAPVAIVTAMVQNQVLEGKSTVKTYPHWYSEFNASIYGQCMGTRLITLPPCRLSVTQLHKN